MASILVDRKCQVVNPEVDAQRHSLDPLLEHLRNSQNECRLLPLHKIPSGAATLRKFYTGNLKR